MPDAPQTAGITRTLDELQARDRAEAHSLGCAFGWKVVRTPLGHHVCFPSAGPALLPDDYTIVATYRNGKEV